MHRDQKWRMKMSAKYWKRHSSPGGCDFVTYWKPWLKQNSPPCFSSLSAKNWRLNMPTLKGCWIERIKLAILLLLLSHFSRVQLCATPETAGHQAPLSLGFSRQEHWSGLPFPSPMHESEKWKWSRFSRVRLCATPWTAAYQAPRPWDFPGKSTGVGCHCLPLNV